MQSPVEGFDRSPSMHVLSDPFAVAVLTVSLRRDLDGAPSHVDVA